MENNDLTKALMKRYDIQEFMGGGTATHTMPDGTVMPGATHEEYEAMGYQDGGAPYSGPLRWETGAVITDAEKINFITALLRKETGAVISDSEMAWADQTYFPQMGDSAITVEEKRQAREQAAQQMEQSGDPRSAGFGQRMRQGIGTETGAVMRPEEMQNMLLTREMMENPSPMQTLPWTREMEENQLPMTPFGSETGAAIDPAQELQKALQELELQKTQTKDPSEIKLIDKMIENASIAANAPYAALMEEVAATGGEDDLIAHVRSGDINVSRELMQKNPKIEKEIEKTAVEMGLDPEEMVHGTGLASLNIYTGVEQHGFLKKLAKGIKKIAKKVAPIAGPLANFIPGVGPVLAGVIGAGTNLAAGKGLKGAITGGLSGFGTGKMLGGIGSLGTVGGKAVGSGNFGALGFGDKLTALRTGFGSGNMASTFFNPAQGSTGMFGGQIGPSIRSGIGSLTGWGQPMPGGVPGAGSQYQIQPGDTLSEIAQANGMTTEQLAAFNGIAPENMDMIQAGATLNIPGAAGAATQGGGFWGNVGEYIMPGQDNVGLFGNLQNTMGGMFGGGGGGMFGGGGGGMGGLGSLAMAGVPAYMLGKMAADEARADKGIPLTPLTTMGPTGRYNIEAEIARRMGTQSPNPIEYGLLPEGTIPELSGGRPMAAAGGGAVYPMAYAEGGNVAMEDFQRMNGGINGEGTETSDDIPAMLSDGEFVMTGAAVRGAGGYDLNNQDGILTLTPSGTPDREKGTNMMYEMMDLFSDYVGDSRSMANV